MAVRTLDDGIVTDETFGSLAAGSILGNPTNAVGPAVATGGGTTGQVPTKQADGSWAWATPAGGGGVSDGNKGDITVSGGGSNWQINAAAVGTNELGIGVVTQVELASNAVSTAKILDGALSADATGRAKVADGFVVDAKVSASAAIALSKLASMPALASRQVIAGAGLTGGGDLSADRTLDVVAGDGTIVVNANNIVAGVMQSVNIENVSIGTAKLADDAVSFAKAGFYLGEFTAVAANDWDIALPSGYQGQDTHAIVVDIEGTAAAAGFFDILLNGSDTVDSKQVFVQDGDAAPTNGGSNGPGVIASSERSFVRLVLHLRDGGVRLVSTETIGVFSGAFRHYFGMGRWTDTTTDITSLRLRLDGGTNWTAGAKAAVWAF